MQYKKVFLKKFNYQVLPVEVIIKGALKKIIIKIKIPDHFWTNNAFVQRQSEQ